VERLLGKEVVGRVFRPRDQRDGQRGAQARDIEVQVVRGADDLFGFESGELFKLTFDGSNGGDR
jgi:hypothetical protein